MPIFRRFDAMTFEIIQEEGKVARFLMNGQDISEPLLSAVILCISPGAG